MRVALVNPAWSFEGSIYFGCREPHLPLELGCCAALLERGEHEALLFDAALDGMDAATQAEAIAARSPDMTVVTTAPSYLFWRCAPPELTVPRDFLRRLGGRGGMTVAVGPHGSTTPGATLRKLGCDVVVRGECEEVVVALAANPEGAVDGTARFVSRRGARGDVEMHGPNAATRFTELPALHWPDHWIRHHAHHHHRFDVEPRGEPRGPGAEVEASRGCPYACSFCAKIDFRDGYRRRHLPTLLTEIDRLVAQGVSYLYFIDEIFLPWPELLDALTNRPVQFGVQTRIDLWKPGLLARLGAAGCVSIEAGVESLTEFGRDALDKACRMSTDQLTERLVLARRYVPFVQANLIAAGDDDPAAVSAWREQLRDAGVWANDPVPLFPYPGAPDYRKLWGAPDDTAWERAHAHYLNRFEAFSDIQESRPLSLPELEAV